MVTRGCCVRRDTVASVSHRGFKSRWQSSRTRMRLLPAQPERPPAGASLASSLLSALHPRHGSGAHCFSSMVSSVTSVSAQGSICYSPTQAGKLFLGPALTGFPGGSDGKASACNVGDPGSNPGSGRSPGEGNGNPCQYSCLENPMDRGAW